jgi:hypothetical protein
MWLRSIRHAAGNAAAEAGQVVTDDGTSQKIAIPGILERVVEL